MKIKMSLQNPNEAKELIRQLIKQPSKFLFGLDQAIKNTIQALITPLPKDSSSGKRWAQAHTIISDIPGTGKTALFTYLAGSVKAKLGRVDGRPDLLPYDFTGKEERDKWTGIRTLLKGPLHSNIFFADEINRTPPKSQAPMLGAMEGGNVYMNVTNEKEGIIESVAFPLYPISDDPNETRLFFTVFATMNPIEFEGTYPPSEAQMERFTYHFGMGFPSREEEKKIRGENVMDKKVEVVMSLGDLLDIHEMVKQIKLSSDAHELIQRYLENSRTYEQDEANYGKVQRRFVMSDLPAFINRYVLRGCSPRRNYHMQYAALAHRFMRFVFSDKNIESPEQLKALTVDVKAVAPLTMEHVIILQPRALGDNITPKKVVRKIIEETVMP
jgi:MoxR-like ATPase